MYMPHLSSTAFHIWKSEEEVNQQDQQLKSERQLILDYLAGVNTQGSLKPEPARLYTPELGQHGCFDTTIFQIFFRIVYNPIQLTKDTLCGCFTRCSLPEPTRHTYVTKHVYNQLRSADIYLNRNTCLLCCVTPCLITSCAFAGYLPLSAPVLQATTSIAGAAANDCSLFSAGWLTYFWSGDFGGREQKSYEEMKGIFDDLAEHLDDNWHQAAHDNQKMNDLQHLCEKIRKNSLNITQGMENGGISPLHVDDITKKLFRQIKHILQGIHYQNIENCHALLQQQTAFEMKGLKA